MEKVTVYSTQNCPYCRMAKAFLEKNGVEFRNIDVSEDRVAAEEMVKLSGQFGVPVILVDKEVIIGFDAQRLKEIFTPGETGNIYDIIIIGAGPAGLTAGVYCARKQVKTLLISENIGGQALESWAIENYMGYRMVSGEELMKRFEEQVREQDVGLELSSVIKITKEDGNFRVSTANDSEYIGRAVILAQGKRPRKLGVNDEDRFLGRGISVCSTCDGPLFRDKTVAVVGGGNSALQTAIEMSSIAKEVHLIVRSTIKADEVYQTSLSEKSNITVHEETMITSLEGGDMLNMIRIMDKETKIESDIVLDGLFTEIGWIPNTAFIDGLVELNGLNEIIIDINCNTSEKGIYAAGDSTNVKGKQIIIAAGEGAKAALSAYEYLIAS